MSFFIINCLIWNRRQLPAPSLDGYEESGRTSSEDEGVCIS